MGWTLRIHDSHILILDLLPFAIKKSSSDVNNWNVFPGNCPEIGEMPHAGFPESYMTGSLKYYQANIKVNDLINDWGWQSIGLEASLRGRSFEPSMHIQDCLVWLWRIR